MSLELGEAMGWLDSIAQQVMAWTGQCEYIVMSNDNYRFFNL